MKTAKFLIKNAKKFKISDIRCDDTLDYKKSDRARVEAEMHDNLLQVEKLQDKLYAQSTHSLLVIFQAMDAAGKDGTIKHVMSGLNPQGCQVACFKSPSSTELDHDYLWRITKELPARGNIGIFNRSHYEEVLVVKVHELHKKQLIPEECIAKDFWKRRYLQINNFEQYLVENGIELIKIFLHVSKKEQKKRILERIDDPSKNWKFDAGDLAERQYWDAYQTAFEEMINHTSTEYAPWHVVPADNKWFARAVVSAILLNKLKRIDPQYPELPKDQQQLLSHYKELMENEK
jgi:PPK2 family polyphosphate:nucleotide phosphotransferase